MRTLILQKTFLIDVKELCSLPQVSLDSHTSFPIMTSFSSVMLLRVFSLSAILICEIKFSPKDSTSEFNITIKNMIKNKWGRIINIASLQSLRAFDNSIPYGASKGGIMQLTRALAQAYSKDGVLVNAIAPGFFRTNLTESLFQDPGKLQTLADKAMMGRNGEEKDIFGISVFLCSDANSYVTGQTIFLDGGFSAA